MKGRVDVEVHLVEGVLTELGITSHEGAQLREEIFTCIFPFLLGADDAVLRGGIFTESGGEVDAVKEFVQLVVVVYHREAVFVPIEHRR